MHKPLLRLLLFPQLAQFKSPNPLELRSQFDLKLTPCVPTLWWCICQNLKTDSETSITQSSCTDVFRSVIAACPFVPSPSRVLRACSPAPVRGLLGFVHRHVGGWHVSPHQLCMCSTHIHTQDIKAASALLSRLGARWLPCSTRRRHVLHKRLRGSPVAIMVQVCACERLEAGKHNTTHVSYWVHVQDIWGCQQWLRYCTVTNKKTYFHDISAESAQRNFPPCQVRITSKW